MRKQMQRVSLDTGNRWAVYLLIGWLAFVAGWVAHTFGGTSMACFWAP